MVGICLEGNNRLSINRIGKVIPKGDNKWELVRQSQIVQSVIDSSGTVVPY